MKFQLAEFKFNIYYSFILKLIYDELVRQNDNIFHENGGNSSLEMSYLKDGHVQHPDFSFTSKRSTALSGLNLSDTLVGYSGNFDKQ